LDESVEWQHTNFHIIQRVQIGATIFVLHLCRYKKDFICNS
jgi:hypothetical protein